MYNTLVKVYSYLNTGAGNVQNALEVHTQKEDVNNIVYKAYDVKGYHCVMGLHVVNMAMSTYIESIVKGKDKQGRNCK
jgi:hypothetical protein